MRHLEKHHGNDSTAKALLRILYATKNRRCSLKQFERPTTVKKEDNSRTRNLKKKILNFNLTVKISAAFTK